MTKKNEPHKNSRPMTERQFRSRAAIAQDGAVSLTDTIYYGPDEPVIVRCTHCGEEFAVKRAATLCNKADYPQCPFCRERRAHQQRMNDLRLRNDILLRSAREYLKLI